MMRVGGAVRTDADVVVVGAGVVGLSCAHALHRRGLRVVVLDADPIATGTSSGNAGHIVPSHVIPFAAPGMVRSAVRDVVGRRGAFGVAPTAGTRAIAWGWRFVRSCTEANVEAAAPALRALNALSVETLAAWSTAPGWTAHVRRTGMMNVHRTAAEHARGVAEADHLRALGVRSEVLDGDAARALEPGLRGEIAGGAYYPDDGFLDPRALLHDLAAPLDVRRARVTDLEPVGDGVTVRTDGATLRADRVVVAAGVWTPDHVRTFVRLPIVPARGYSVTLRVDAPPCNLALMLAEPHVAVTPIAPGLRITGRYEIAGRARPLRERRTRRLIAGARAFLDLPASPEITWRWTGLRPSSPDGLPVIGALERAPRIVVASGHGMLGTSQGPGTGELVARLIAGEESRIPLAAFAPERFARNDSFV